MKTCNICDCGEFISGPGGRLSVYGVLPMCLSCGSLERHRAFRHAWNKLNRVCFLGTKRVLQISDDKSVQPTWFAEHELSVYGGTNSIDIQKIHRASGTYDIIICNHVLEHVPEPRAALVELARILKDDGFMQISFPDPIRLKTTEDWGYPKDDQHGHYRVFGEDVVEMLAAALPNFYLLTVVGVDPVTGSEDLLFFLSKTGAIRQLYPDFTIKSFQRLGAIQVVNTISQLKLELEHSKRMQLMPGRIQVFYWPDFTVTNPYQRLLSSSFRAPFFFQPMTIDDVNDLTFAPGAQRIFHLHWLSPIFSGCRTEREAFCRGREYAGKLERFKASRGIIFWTIHNCISHESVYFEAEIELCQRLVQLVDRVHVHSERAVKLVSTFYNIPPEKIVVAQHGNYSTAYPNHITKSEARHRLGISNDKKVFLLFGQLRAYKGIKSLVSIVHDVQRMRPDFHVVVAGDSQGADQSDIELLKSAERTMGMTVVLEFVDDSDVQIFFNACDFVVLPYSRILTSGACFLAFTFGRPIIAPELGLVSEVITDNRNGFLYNTNDPKGLGQAIQRALAICGSEYEKFSRFAHEVADTFCWAHVGLRLTEQILSLRFPGRLVSVVDGRHGGCLAMAGCRDGLGRARTAAIVVHYRHLDDTRRCIASLLHGKADLDIFVVSNDDDLNAFIELGAMFPQVTAIQSNGNIGFAAGNNQALRMVRDRDYTYVWLVNPDVVVEPDTQALFEQAADEHPEYAGFGPIIFFGDRKDIIWFGGGGISWNGGFEVFHYYMGETCQNLPNSLWQAEYITGASLFFRKELLAEVGLLPEEFFLYFEETSWCMDASRRGFKFAVLPNIRIFHYKRSDEKGLPTDTYLYYYVRNLINISNRDQPDIYPLTRRKLDALIVKWLGRIEEEQPTRITAARDAIDQGIRDGEHGIYGKRV